MEAIRKIMDVERLMPIMDIPAWMQNIKVEVTIFPYANPAVVEQNDYSKAEKVAAARALIGMLPPEVDLDTARAERLSK